MPQRGIISIAGKHFTNGIKTSQLYVAPTELNHENYYVQRIWRSDGARINHEIMKTQNHE